MEQLTPSRGQCLNHLSKFEENINGSWEQTNNRMTVLVNIFLHVFRFSTGCCWYDHILCFAYMWVSETAFEFDTARVHNKLEQLLFVITIYVSLTHLFDDWECGLISDDVRHSGSLFVDYVLAGLKFFSLFISRFFHSNYLQILEPSIVLTMEIIKISNIP